MKLLTLNCQKGYDSHLADFIRQLYEEQEYDFVLLQEVSDSVAAMTQGIGNSYVLVRPENPATHHAAQTAILHRSSFILKEQRFFPVAHLIPEQPG